ncbi:MAG: S24/S26 family peptidase [Muribaculaceae bacterium]|nr:S24/S26 family peptidase [Muribaculaceae bacterium]
MNKPHTIPNEVLLGQVCAMLAEGRKVKLRAKGNSMRPFIHGDEDTLVLAPVSVLRPWDIVLARTCESNYVVHRIISIKNGRVTLAGDGNLYRREECDITDVFGIVVTLIRSGRERSLTSFHTRLYAFSRYCLLPVRRVIWKIRAYK